MAIKLVAIDIDDTLLDSRHRIPPACIKAIQRVRNRGVLVVLATGRMFRAALPYARELDLDMPLITYQGALVKCALSNEVLYERTIRIDLARELIGLLEQGDIDYHVYINDRLYTKKLIPVVLKHSQITGIEPVLIKEMDKILNEHEPMEIMAVFPRQSAREMVEGNIRKMYGQDLHITRFKYDSLEIMHRHATKARALAAIAVQYNIQQQEVMAIGDSYNDLPMIEWAGIGVAVANAHLQVKQAADFVSGSNEEEGIVQALDKFIP